MLLLIKTGNKHTLRIHHNIKNTLLKLHLLQTHKIYSIK